MKARLIMALSGEAAAHFLPYTQTDSTSVCVRGFTAAQMKGKGSGRGACRNHADRTVGGEGAVVMETETKHPSAEPEMGLLVTEQILCYCGCFVCLV